MKLLIVLCLVAMVAAAPQKRYSLDSDTRILKYERKQQPNGNYFYSYEQSDGQKAEQYGEVKNEGQENESLVMRGSYSWVDPDGVIHRVTYTADEDGYQPEVEEGAGPGVQPAVVASLLG